MAAKTKLHRTQSLDNPEPSTHGPSRRSPVLAAMLEAGSIADELVSNRVQSVVTLSGPLGDRWK